MRTLIVLLLILHFESVFAQANYTKTAEIPPLRVSFGALQAVLEKTEKLISTANSGVKPRREEVLLKAGAVQVGIPGRTLAPPNAKVPEQVESLTYTYLAKDDLPITRIYLDFSDYRRILTVEGTAPEQVDAIFAAVREELVAISSNVGGSGIKLILGPVAYWALLMIGTWSGLTYYSYRTRRSLAVLAGAVSVSLLLLVLPTGELLSGFLAFRGDPSFMVRYGPEMSFIGFLLAVIGIPLTILQMSGTRSGSGGVAGPSHPKPQTSSSDGPKS